MKLGNKIKWTFTTLGMVATTAIPMSISLVSCGSPNNNFESNNSFNLFNENYNLNIDDNFSNNLKNTNLAWNIPQDEYDIIKKITDSDFKHSIDYNNLSSNPIQIAKNWLNNANFEDIQNLLIINFNRNNDIYSMNSKNEFSRKNFIRVKVQNYDSSTHSVDFGIEINRNESYIIDDSYKTEPYSSRLSYKIVYEFKNIILKPTEINGLAILTMDINNNSSSIKMINYKYKGNPEIEWNAYHSALDNALKYNWTYNGKIVDQSYYNELILEYQKLRELNINEMNTIYELVNSEWNSKDIVDNDDYLNHLFSLYDGNYDSFIGIKPNNDTLTWEKDKISKPNFLITYFDNNDIKVIY